MWKKYLLLAAAFIGWEAARDLSGSKQCTNCCVLDSSFQQLPSKHSERDSQANADFKTVELPAISLSVGQLPAIQQEPKTSPATQIPTAPVEPEQPLARRPAKSS